jgi:hypothetical protein
MGDLVVWVERNGAEGSGGLCEGGMSERGGAGSGWGGATLDRPTFAELKTVFRGRGLRQSS